MKTVTKLIDEPENREESTYALLMRSEEKSRNLLEMLIYPLLILGAVIAIWQFVLQKRGPAVGRYEGSIPRH